jgi:hypothetical protein
MRTEKSRNNMFGIAALKMVRKTKVGFLDFLRILEKDPLKNGHF